jgi:hypothetical protein
MVLALLALLLLVPCAEEPRFGGGGSTLYWER